MTPATPPLAARLLAAALGRAEWTESILGDLHEEHASAPRPLPGERRCVVLAAGAAAGRAGRGATSALRPPMVARGRAGSPTIVTWRFPDANP